VRAATGAATAPVVQASSVPETKHRAAEAVSAGTRTAAAHEEKDRKRTESSRAEAPRTAAEHAEAERAKALLEGRSVAAAPASRYVVQVGAFADAQAAREVRQKVEKLGLKTYTQVAQTSAGSRIRVRVGPFASRGEADAVLAKARAAGLAAVVVTL
jgi:DedD protein